MDTRSHNEENEHFARHGGVHFVNLVPPEEINLFIRRLPAGKRESLFEVLSELDKHGLISIQNDGLLADGEGELHGSDEC